MPCDEIRTVTLDLQAADRPLLLQAIESLGLQAALDADGRLTFWTANGIGRIWGDRLTVPEADAGLVNQIKATYSRAAVTAASQRFGWRVQETGAQQLTLTRRS